jgi:uncharacterized lipoprotein
MKYLMPGLAVLLLLAGCSTNKYCERGERAYENVVESPPLTAPEGLSVPKPDPNQAIPKATGPEVPFATKEQNPGKKGGTRSKCLDTPPPLPAEQAPAKPATPP